MGLPFSFPAHCGVSDFSSGLSDLCLRFVTAFMSQVKQLSEYHPSEFVHVVCRFVGVKVRTNFVAACPTQCMDVKANGILAKKTLLLLPRLLCLCTFQLFALERRVLESSVKLLLWTVLVSWTHVFNVGVREISSRFTRRSMSLPRTHRR